MAQHLYSGVIDTVFRIISERAPTQSASRYIDERVVLKMDGISAQGFHYWCLWVDYMRNFGRFANLSLVRGQTVIDGNWVEVKGIASGDLKNHERVEHEIFVKYRFIGTKIAEIHTTRFNYVAAFGNKIKYKWIFYGLVLHMLLWARFSGRQS